MRVIIALCILIIMLLSPTITLGAGKVKYYQIDSKILANGGEQAQRELGIYLPEEYDTSGTSYPVLYLIHGFTGNNRTFFGGGYGGAMSNANVSLIMDRLIQEGKITPFIVVCPDVNRIWMVANGVDIPPDLLLLMMITLLRRLSHLLMQRFAQFPKEKHEQ